MCVCVCEDHKNWARAESNLRRPDCGFSPAFRPVKIARDALYDVR